MKASCNLLIAGASLLFATVAPLRADFISTATLTAAADNAVNSTGSGSATVDWNAATDTFSYVLTWTGLTGSATMAHIHIGAPGVNGPVVIPFFTTVMPAADSLSGTLTAADFSADPTDGVNTIADVATAIEDGDAYVNIHTAEYPGGEIRGQLAVSNVPEPATTGLMLLALIGGASALTRKRRLLTRP